MDTYLHLPSGKTYHNVNFNTLRQVEGEWVQGMISYYSTDPSVTHEFQREPEEFAKKFIKVVKTAEPRVLDHYRDDKGETNEPSNKASTTQSRGEGCPTQVPSANLNMAYEG